MRTLNEEDLKSDIEIAILKMLQSFDSFEGLKSGWVIEEVLHLQVKIGVYQPLRGSSYIETPHELSKKKAILNIQNQDEKCFLWSILAALYPVDQNPERVNKYL